MRSKWLLLVVCFLLLTAWAALAAAAGSNGICVFVTPETKAQLQVLEKLEAYAVSEIPPHRLGRSYEFILPTNELEALQRQNLQCEIKATNRNVWNDADYYSYQEVYDTLVAVVAAYPNIATMEIMGYSTRDNVEIWGLKLSDNPAFQEDEPDVIFNSVIHAREPVNANITMGFIEEMTQGYGLDQEITSLIDNTEIWVIPLLNPEGYLYVETGIDNPWWRKNKRDNDLDGEFEGVVEQLCDGSFFSYPDGVDLNRNYKEGWTSGGSTLPCSIVYRGPTYFSENESALERDLFAREHPVAAISFHSYSEYVGYCGNDLAGRQLCYNMASAIGKESNIGTYAAEFFYGSGQSYNWMYWDHGVQAYLIETGTEFFPTGVARIAGIVENNLNAMRVLLNRVQGSAITGHVVDAVTNAPLIAEVALLGEATINAPRKSESVYGRFFRLVRPGTHMITVRKTGYHTAVFSNVVVEEGVAFELEVYLVPESSDVAETPPLSVLGQNHPNPFNPSTAINFSVDRPQNVEISLYDMAGRLVSQLTDHVYPIGDHNVQWHGTNSAGLEMPSGTYLVRLKAGKVIESQKIMLIR